MTRRTPQPGDTYSKGDWFVKVGRVECGAVYGLWCAGGISSLFTLSLRDFHELIDLEAWSK